MREVVTRSAERDRRLGNQRRAVLEHRPLAAGKDTDDVRHVFDRRCLVDGHADRTIRKVAEVHARGFRGAAHRVRASSSARAMLWIRSPISRRPFGPWKTAYIAAIFARSA